MHDGIPNSHHNEDLQVWTLPQPAYTTANGPPCKGFRQLHLERIQSCFTQYKWKQAFINQCSNISALSFSLYHFTFWLKGHLSFRVGADVFGLHVSLTHVMVFRYLTGGPFLLVQDSRRRLWKEYNSFFDVALAGKLNLRYIRQSCDCFLSIFMN